MKKSKIFIISFFVVMLDQLTKLIIKTNFKLLDTKTIIENFFYITYMKNDGAAFSILKNMRLFLILVSIIVLVALVFNIKKSTEITKLSSISYSLLIGGIIGNLIDRIFIGKVIDFLSFKIINYYFPVFNLADMAIVMGIVLLIIESIGVDLGWIQKK